MNLAQTVTYVGITRGKAFDHALSRHDPSHHVATHGPRWSSSRRFAQHHLCCESVHSTSAAVANGNLRFSWSANAGRFIVIAMEGATQRRHMEMI